MNILIIGGNRFVGKLLADIIGRHNTDNTIDVFNRTGTGPSHTGKIKGDRNFRNNVCQIDFNKYDTIVDMCLYNIPQARIIIPLIEQSNVKQYIFISSVASVIKIFGDYGRQKADIEQLLKQTCIPYVILRPTYILGPGNPHYREAYYFDKIRDQSTITIDGTGDKILSFVSATDVANFIYKVILAKMTKETYNLCGDDKINLTDFVKMFFKIAGKTTTIRSTNLGIPFPNKDFFLSNHKAKEHFNFQFTPLKTMLTDFYDTNYH